MDTVTLSRAKFLAIVIIVFFFSFLFGHSIKKETVVTKEVQVQIPAKCDDAQLSTWQSLKLVDDEGFEYCRQELNLASQGFKAVANEDLKTATSVVNQMSAITDLIGPNADRRNELLKLLNY